MRQPSPLACSHGGTCVRFGSGGALRLVLLLNNHTRGTRMNGTAKQGGWRLGRSRRRASDHVVFDGFDGDPEIGEAVTGLINGDWSVANDLMDRRPHDGWLITGNLTGDHSDIAIGAFQKWVSEAPSARSLAMLGHALVREAWDIRTRRPSAQVDPGAWQGFFTGLRVAEAAFRAALAKDADHTAAPWVGLLRTGRGLQVDKEELRARFGAMYAIEGFRPDGCSQLLQGLCEKWGGSHDEMFAVARWVEAEAPADSAAHSVIFEAHFEYSINQDGVRPSTHFADPATAGELEAASLNYLAAIPHQAETRHLLVLNWILFVLRPRDDHSAKIIEEAVRRIDGRQTAMPWACFGIETPAAHFQEVRDARIALARRLH